MIKTSEEKQDVEANKFAIELLMPEKNFIVIYKRELKSMRTIDEDKLFQKLANIFEVPLFSIVLRIQSISPEKLQ